MTVKVKLNTSNTGIVVRPNFAVASSPSGSVVIKNAASTLSASRLDTLQDVVEGANPEDKSTLVYNSLTDKYEVKKLDIGELGDLDGGSF